MTLRTIKVQTDDGQTAIFNYETEAADDTALETEFLAAITESTVYNIQTSGDGSTASFYAPINSVTFYT